MLFLIRSAPCEFKLGPLRTFAAPVTTATTGWRAGSGLGIFVVAMAAIHGGLNRWAQHFNL